MFGVNAQDSSTPPTPLRATTSQPDFVDIGREVQRTVAGCIYGNVSRRHLSEAAVLLLRLCLPLGLFLIFFLFF